MPANNHIEEFFEIWNEMPYDARNQTEIEEFSSLMDSYARINKQFINIYSLKQKKVLYMSDNLKEVLGYEHSKKDYEKKSALLWLRDLPISQSVFFVQMSVFYKNQIQKILEAGNISSFTFFLHNFKLKPFGSHTRHLGLACTVLDLDKSPYLDKILIMNTNVEPLIKDKNSWWCFLSANNDTFYSKHSETSGIKEKHLISSKALEVLNLLDQGEKTKEIADKLEISIATVEKHRNNLLELTGAKDISSLLQLAKMAHF